MGDQFAKTCDRRLMGLRRFAIAITVLNLLGHFWFGFEQSWAQMLVALGTAYAVELGLETIGAALEQRRARFFASKSAFIEFLLPAHITGLAIGMLLYGNDRLGVFAFASATAIASKVLISLPGSKGRRHLMNPSNFGITATLLLFPWVGIAPPYHFTENLNDTLRWGLPILIIFTGSFLNQRLTQRLPLIASWLSCFVLQALLRHWLVGASLAGALMPMSGMAFLLFTFYMVTDPGTTPSSVRGQITFGSSVACVYSLLMLSHIVFGLFFALTAVCAGRGLLAYVEGWSTQRSSQPEAAIETASPQAYVLEGQRM